MVSNPIISVLDICLDFGGAVGYRFGYGLFPEGGYKLPWLVECWFTMSLNLRRSLFTFASDILDLLLESYATKQSSACRISRNFFFYCCLISLPKLVPIKLFAQILHYACCCTGVVK